MAAQFNADGTIKGYADLKIQVNGISATVTDNKNAADAAFNTLNNTTLPAIRNNITSAYNLADSAWDYADNAYDLADEADRRSRSSATWINQNKDKIELVSAQFDSSGKLTNTSGLVTGNGTFSSLFASALRSDGTVAKVADITVFVDNYGTTNAAIRADHIKFSTFDWTVTNPDTGDTIFHLDSNGNLSIGGTITGGTITGDVAIGNGTRKMYIEPTSTGARLVGKDGSYETLHLGFYQYNGNSVPAMYLKSKASNYQDSLVRVMSGSDFAEVLAESAGSTGAYHIIRMIAYPRDDYATIEGNYWPKKSDTTVYNKLSNGAVYVDNGYLKVKGW